MQGSPRIIIAAGVTSNLCASILPFLKNPIGLHRPTSDIRALQNRGVALVCTENILQTCQDLHEPGTRYLWFSTHSDIKTLSGLAELGPTLAIGSGVAIDFLAGRVPVSNDYIRDKVAMLEIPGLYTLVPGFFLDDCGSKTGGLHRETTTKVFQETFDDTYDWGKPKFVTPKSLLCDLILHWLVFAKPPTSEWHRVGSICAYNRWELRQMAILDVPQAIKERYPVQSDVTYTTGICCSHEQIMLAIKNLI